MKQADLQGILQKIVIRFFVDMVQASMRQESTCPPDTGHNLAERVLKNMFLNKLSVQKHRKKNLSTILIAGFASLTLTQTPVSAAPVSAAPVSANAKYVLSVAGTIVADINIELNNNGADYTLDLDANVAGLGNLVAQGSANIDVSGSSSGGKYSGEDFQLITRSSQNEVDIKVSYNNNNVTAFVVTPPFQPRIDQVPVQRSQLRGVSDMLSAFVIQADGLNRSICQRKLRIFTGIERFDLQMRYAASETATSTRTGYQGPVILCQLAYNPISGHYTSSEITAYLQASERILIWYAPVANSNTYIPYRVLVGTSLGDLSMVLTRLN